MLFLYSNFICYFPHYNPFLSGKNRGIAIPVDLDTQVAAMFNKNAMISKHTRAWLSAARTPRAVPSSTNVFRNDRSIIEGLQVSLHVLLESDS